MLWTLGPNGAGKTTTIRMLITLIPATSGTMSIAGLDVKQNKMIIRRLLGYVPQSLSADGSLTGYENLLVMAKLLGLSAQERKRRIEQVLEVLNLTHAAYQMVQTYSGGMVRRLEIGQAILNVPIFSFWMSQLLSLTRRLDAPSGKQWMRYVRNCK